MQRNNFKTGLVSHSDNSYDQWFIVSYFFWPMSLVTPAGYHTKWNMADFELPTILSQIGSFVCSCEVGVQLQQCMLLYDMCANNSINSDERSRAHSYSVQQQSPVSSQWPFWFQMLQLNMHQQAVLFVNLRSLQFCNTFIQTVTKHNV